MLFIDGTPGDDRISLVATSDGLVLANKGGWSTILPDHFALIRINGARGNDVVIVDGSVTTDSIVHGSNGDVTLLGGAGDDHLFGGQGRDRILAGAGDDMIVSIGDSIQDRARWTFARRYQAASSGERGTPVAEPGIPSAGPGIVAVAVGGAWAEVSPACVRNFASTSS